MVVEDMSDLGPYEKMTNMEKRGFFRDLAIPKSHTYTQAELNAAVEAAREECARVASSMSVDEHSPTRIAKAIRALNVTGALDRLEQQWKAKIAAVLRNIAGFCNHEARVQVLNMIPEDAQRALSRAVNEVRLEEAWIPISEKLAPPHKTVLALCSNGDIYQARVCYGMHAPYWCGHSDLNFGNVLSDAGLVVTHWKRIAELKAALGKPSSRP